MAVRKIEYFLQSAEPDFKDLPWDLPLNAWPGNCDRLEIAPMGVHRHPVVFVNYAGVLYALKELPHEGAAREFKLLSEAEKLHIPVVSPVGFVRIQREVGQASVLITRYLEGSLPYRILLSRQGFELYRSHLLDAIAGLMVEIHLCGLFWGDCSLSNTLFRRDAGALRAYVVDLETSEIHAGHTDPTLRFHDLQLMEENVNSELIEMHREGVRLDSQLGVPVSDTGGYIRVRYQILWDQVNREDILLPGEHYRIQERVRALNQLGFSVEDIELLPAGAGNQVFLRVIVSDRHFHRDHLFNLTGLEAEEKQAQRMVNEIQEIRAWQTNETQRNTPLAVAAHYWLENIFKPVTLRLAAVTDRHTTLAELYCQVLEHKWYLSERAQHDVGHAAATEDFLRSYWMQSRMEF